jgi:hypothetical protein
MPAQKSATSAIGRPSGTIEYRGKRAKTGNSSGFRFEGALFRSHPEFNGEVRAHVIAPGRMLITAERAVREKSDPVMASFLAFLARDIATRPETIRPLDGKLARRIDRLVKGVKTNPDDDLGHVANF